MRHTRARHALQLCGTYFIQRAERVRLSFRRDNAVRTCVRVPVERVGHRLARVAQRHVKVDLHEFAHMVGNALPPASGREWDKVRSAPRKRPCSSGDIRAVAHRSAHRDIQGSHAQACALRRAHGPFTGRVRSPPVGNRHQRRRAALLGRCADGAPCTPPIAAASRLMPARTAEFTTYLVDLAGTSAKACIAALCISCSVAAAAAAVAPRSRER